MPGNANKTNIIAGLFKAFASETITVGASATSLTSATYTTDGEKAKRAIITIQGGQLRYFYSGETPTSSIGHLVNVFDVIVLLGSDNINNFRAIRVTNDSTITVTYEN